MPSAIGRMLRMDISKSRKFASLCSDSQRLFVMIIPHLNSFGKIEAQPELIKAMCVPLLKDMTIKKIEKCLVEITEKTSMKWFEFNGWMYIHALSWEEHQNLRQDKLGADTLPSYSKPIPVPVQERSGTAPGLFLPEGKVREVKKKLITTTIPLPPFQGGIDFESLWQRYPRPEGKKAAKRSFEKELKLDPKVHVRIEKALINYLAYVRHEKKELGFIQKASTWLNNWQDWENYNGGVPTPKPPESEEARTKRLSTEKKLRENWENEMGMDKLLLAATKPI